MARVKGGLFTSTLDVSKRFPLDSRMLVSQREDLINPATWIINTLTTEATYNAMIVSVNSDGEHNGIYYLLDRKEITQDNYDSYKAAKSNGEETEQFFSMWMKLGTLGDLLNIENQLKQLREYIDEQIENIDLSEISLRRDNDYNYKKIEDTFVPKKGEVCFVDVSGYGLRTKVGDGKSTFKQLPYNDETIINQINGLIVRGYYYQNEFYLDSDHINKIDKIVGRIYIEALTSKIYTYDGNNYSTQNIHFSNATAETAGLVKLYDEVGNNTDGTMTQKAITKELNEKFEMDVVKEEEMVVFDIDID